MNRSMMPKQIMAYNQGGIASFIPQQTQIMGQPHRLAYVNPQEEQMMLNAGGAGLPGPGGIPAYWTLTEPSTWGDGQGYQGVGNFNASDNDNSGGNSSNDNDNNTQTMTVGEYYDNPPETSSDSVGFVDSIAMGFGFKDKTPAYYNTTAQTIAASQGQNAAQNYLNNLSDDGTINANDWQIFSDNASQVSLNPALSNNFLDNTSALQNTTDGTADGTADGITDDIADDTADDTADGTADEIQYTQMAPFYGGYTPATVSDILVPSQAVQEMTGSFNNSGSTEANGQFNSMEELLAFQQANPNVNLMSEYNRLKNLYGSSFDEIENKGIGPLFNGSETQLAGNSMYQGIMG